MKSLLARPDVRRLGTFLALAMLAALVTGPDGTQARPWSGFQHSWLDVRVLQFLVPAVLLAFAGTFFAPRKAAVTAAVSRTRQTVTKPLARPMVKSAIYGAMALFAVLYPLRLSNYWLTVLVDQIGIYVLLAIGLNVVVGFAGLLDLGYIAFYAIGAYTTAYFTGKLPAHPPVTLNPFLIFPVAVLIAMLAGLLLGAPTLRLRGDYLAIVTLGFGEIVRITAVNTDSVTNGPRGTFGVPHFSINLGFFHYKWTLSQLPYYYLLLVVIALVWFVLARLEDSRIGRAWTAIREDEVAAEASGIPTLKLKLMAFAIGASTSGFAGVIYASKVGSFTPDNFVLLQSILVLVMVIFGGMGSIPGVMLGAVVLGWLPNYLRDYVRATDRFIYFGALLVIMMIFRPQGLLPSKRRAREIAIVEDAESVLGAEAEVVDSVDNS